MIIHKEHALRRFCEVPLKHAASRILLERIWQNRKMLQRLVFVTRRDCLPNTMVVAQEGANEIAFRLQLSEIEAESLSLANGQLIKEQRKMGINQIDDPLLAWEALQDFGGLLHVELAFQGEIPDWYLEIAVPNEAVHPSIQPPGFAAFVRDQVELLLWAVTLKNKIDTALRTGDKELFLEVVPLYKEVCRSCFWQL